jgi:hypothetical protein
MAVNAGLRIVGKVRNRFGDVTNVEHKPEKNTGKYQNHRLPAIGREYIPKGSMKFHHYQR